MAALRFIAVFSPNPSELYKTAHRISPRVEIYPPDGLIFEVPAQYEQETLSQLSNFPDSSLQIGSASTRTAAIFVAKIRPGSVLPYGRERGFLAPFPIHFLSFQVPLEDSTLETLRRWGIKTLGDLSSLPEPALVGRLGQQGLLLQKIARGEEAVFLQPHHPREKFSASQDMDWPVESLEPLTFILGGLLEQICSRLKKRGLAVEKIQVDLKLENGHSHKRSITLALPMQTPNVILSLIRLELQGRPPQAGITEVKVEAIPAVPRILQSSLFEPSAPHPEKLSRTLTRLSAIVGSTNLGTPKLLDTYRPDAVVLESFRLSHPVTKPSQKSGKKLPELRKDSGKKFSSATIEYPVTQLSLRRLRPPQPFRIHMDRIVSCAGPWKSSGDWWMEPTGEDRWSREEWDIEMTDGSVYRIFWDNRTRGWFLEGVYD